MIDDAAGCRGFGSAFVFEEETMTVGLNLTQLQECSTHIEILQTKRRELEASIAAANETLSGMRAHLRHVLSGYNAAAADAWWFTQNIADETTGEADRLEDQDDHAECHVAVRNFIERWRTWDGARISETDLSLPGDVAELDLGHAEALAGLPIAIDP